MSRTAEAADKTSVNAQQRRRLHQYKLSFYVVTFGLQCADVVSDIQAEVTYFVGGSRGGGGNGTDSFALRCLLQDSGSQQLGDVFNVCYALHAVASLLVSIIVLRRVAALFQNLQKRLTKKSAGSKKAKRRSTTSSAKLAKLATQRAATEMAIGEENRTNSGDGVSRQHSPAAHVNADQSAFRHCRRRSCWIRSRPRKSCSRT